MFKNLLRKLRLKPADVVVIDAVITKVADTVTKGAASKVEDVVETITKKK